MAVNCNFYWEGGLHCRHVCLYACMHVCMCVCMCVRVCACMCIRACAYMCVCVCVFGIVMLLGLVTSDPCHLIYITVYSF